MCNFQFLSLLSPNISQKSRKTNSRYCFFLSFYLFDFPIYLIYRQLPLLSMRNMCYQTHIFIQKAVSQNEKRLALYHIMYAAYSADVFLLIFFFCIS